MVFCLPPTLPMTHLASCLTLTGRPCIRRSISTKFCMRIEVHGPCHYLTLQTFLGLINSLAARGHQKFGWKRPHRCKLFIILSFIELNYPNLADLYRLRTSIKPVNFVRIAQGVRPLGAMILVKYQIFKVFWAVNPNPWAYQGEILQGGAALPPAKFHLDRFNVSPLRGEKPKNWSVSKTSHSVTLTPMCVVRFPPNFAWW